MISEAELDLFKSNRAQYAYYLERLEAGTEIPAYEDYEKAADATFDEARWFSIAIFKDAAHKAGLDLHGIMQEHDHEGCLVEDVITEYVELIIGEFSTPAEDYVCEFVEWTVYVIEYFLEGE